MDKDVAVTFQSSSSAIEPIEVDPDPSSKRSWLRNTYSNLSQSRQIFCLFCVFDFLFTFFLWIIYAQGVSVTGLDDSLSDEIGHYGITSSLFDLTIMSFVRVSILLVAYGYYANEKIYAVLFTTVASTIYLIVKAVVFEFNKPNNNGNRPVDYLLHIGSFILCWVEAWYLKVKVFPRERKEGLLKNSKGQDYGTVKGASSAYSVLSFHTPPEEDSDEEEAVYRANLHYIVAARESTNKALKFLYAEKVWDIEKQKGDILLESTQDDSLGKVVRLRTSIDANTSTVYPLVFGDIENYRKWNDSLTHVEVIYKVNTTTDITYSSLAEVAGGLISARDFVNLRHFQRIGSMFINTSSSTTTDLKPPVEGVVRGETLLNCYALSPAEEDPEKSDFVWIATTAFKPSSVPQGIIDRTMPGFLIECVQKLKKCCEEIKCKENPQITAV